MTGTAHERRETDVAIASIEVGDRLRKVDVQTITDLAADLAKRGMLQRIGVRERTDAKVDLAWGRHRLEAAAKLGWSAIPAVVYPADLPDDQVLVLEIVENLKRRELTPEERAEHVTRLAALVKDVRANSLRSGEKSKGRPKGTVQRVAEQSGLSQQAVRRSADKAAEVIGEPVDLERDPPADLVRKADKIRSAPPVPRRKAKAGPKPPPRRKPGPKPRGDLVEAIRTFEMAWPGTFDPAAFTADLPAFQRKDLARTVRRLRERLEAIEAALA